VVDADDRPGRGATAQAFLDGVGFRRVVLTSPAVTPAVVRALSVASVTGRQIMFASNGREVGRLRRVPSRADGLTHPRHGRHAHPDRAGGEALRGRRGREDANKLLKGGKGNSSPLEDFQAADAAGPQDGSLSKLFRHVAGHGDSRTSSTTSRTPTWTGSSLSSTA